MVVAVSVGFLLLKQKNKIIPGENVLPYEKCLGLLTVNFGVL